MREIHKFGEDAYEWCATLVMTNCGVFTSYISSLLFKNVIDSKKEMI